MSHPSLHPVVAEYVLGTRIRVGNKTLHGSCSWDSVSDSQRKVISLSIKALEQKPVFHLLRGCAILWLRAHASGAWFWSLRVLNSSCPIISPCDFGQVFIYFIYYFSIVLCHMACGILVPWAGIEPMTPALEVWSLNHWTTREVPKFLECLSTSVFSSMTWR